MNIDEILIRAKVEQKYEWLKWAGKIPFISFPKEWLIKIMPPFAGAVVRFSAKHPDLPDCISVYLDCYDTLGFYGEPYWEAYSINGDTFRCPMADTNALLCAIDDEFTRRKQNK